MQSWGGGRKLQCNIYTVSAMRMMCFMKYRHSIQRFHRMFRLKLFHHFPLSSPDYPPTSLLITSISATPFLSFYHLSLLLFLQILSNNSLFLTNLPVWRERFKQIYLLTTYASSSKVTSFSPCLSLSALLYPPNIETCANIKARATVAP